MTALLVFAVTADGKVGRLRERREQIQRVRRSRRLQLGREASRKDSPRLLVLYVFRQAKQLFARRQHGKPDVIPIPRRVVRLAHAPRRPPDSAEPDAFTRAPLRPEPN